jgi:hypothetical protein
MDFEKKVKSLMEENELILDELDEMKLELEKKDEEIARLLHKSLPDLPQGEAFLRSTLDSKEMEIDVLKKELEVLNAKLIGEEERGEALELELYKITKKVQSEEVLLKKIESGKVNIEILSDELDEASAYYNSLLEVRSELAEKNSLLESKETEITYLKNAMEEHKELLAFYKTKK